MVISFIRRRPNGQKVYGQMLKEITFPAVVPVTAEQLKPSLRLIGRPIRPTADEVCKQQGSQCGDANSGKALRSGGRVEGDV